MALSKRFLGVTALVGFVAFGLSQCEGDDPYPAIAIAFNKHGAGSAARHLNPEQASEMAMDVCSKIGHTGFGSGCELTNIFEGKSQQCINFGMYFNAQGKMTFTALSYPKGGNENVALDDCNKNGANVCRSGDFGRLCNHE